MNQRIAGYAIMLGMLVASLMLALAAISSAGAATQHARIGTPQYIYTTDTALTVVCVNGHLIVANSRGGGIINAGTCVR